MLCRWDPPGGGHEIHGLPGGNPHVTKPGDLVDVPPDLADQFEYLKPLKEPVAPPVGRRPEKASPTPRESEGSEESEESFSPAFLLQLESWSAKTLKGIAALLGAKKTPRRFGTTARRWLLEHASEEAIRQGLRDFEEA